MILTNLKRYHPKSKKIKKLIFTMNRNWPNHCKFGCKSQCSNLIELIGIDANSEKELEQFEGAFERDEIVNIYIFA
jgi:hypothetical protein